MIKAPINELKKNLSAYTEAAAKGETVYVTRHNQLFVKIEPINKHLHKASSSALQIRPAIQGGTNGESLKALTEDRG